MPGAGTTDVHKAPTDSMSEQVQTALHRNSLRMSGPTDTIECVPSHLTER